MRRALALAAEAAVAGEVPVGAVVVCRASVSSTAESTCESTAESKAESKLETELAIGVNTRERDADPCGHAEVNALRAAAKARGHWRLDGCTLYVTLEPCAMCAGAIVLARIERVVYAAADPKGGFCGTLGDLSAWPGLNHRFAVTGGVCRDEAAAQLRGFFATLRARLRAGKVSN